MKCYKWNVIYTEKEMSNFKNGEIPRKHYEHGILCNVLNSLYYIVNNVSNKLNPMHCILYSFNCILWAVFKSQFSMHYIWWISCYPFFVCMLCIFVVYGLFYMNYILWIVYYSLYYLHCILIYTLYWISNRWTIGYRPKYCSYKLFWPESDKLNIC